METVKVLHEGQEEKSKKEKGKKKRKRKSRKLINTRSNNNKNLKWGFYSITAIFFFCHFFV